MQRDSSHRVSPSSSPQQHYTTALNIFQMEALNDLGHVHIERKRTRKRKKIKEQMGEIKEKISNIKENFRFRSV